MIQHQMFRIRHTELNEIFLVMSLRSFVVGMIAIFVPIYMYTLGYSLRDIFIMNLLMYVFELAFEYLSALVRTEMGPKHAIALSLPFLVAHLWLLATLPVYHWPLWFAALCGGIAMALYWQGYHYDFSKSKRKGQATKDVSRMFIILAILGAIAPFVGSMIATYFGFNALYAVVIVTLGFVFIPLLKQSEEHKKGKLKLGKFKVGPIARDMISYGGAGLDASVSLVIWPLFVFFLLGSYQAIGIITSATLIVTIGVTYLVGKRVSNANRHTYIRTGSYLDGAIYVLLTFVSTFIQVISLNFARSLVSALRSAPYVSEYYLHADETSRSEYIFFMESAIDAAKVVMFAVLIVLTFYFDNSTVLVCGLLFGALGAFMASLMPRAKCEMPYCNADKTIRLIPKLRTKNATH
jgi:hypothetical protein